MEGRAKPRYRVILLGFGAVNTTLLQIVARKRAILPIEVVVVGAADSKGGVKAPPSAATGLSIATLLNHKLVARRSVRDFPRGEGCVAFESTAALVESFADNEYDAVVDGSPVDLKTGGVGLASCRRALSRGRHAVLANKAPLVLAFDELMALSGGGRRVLFSATVCGGLPVVNVGRRDLGGAWGAKFTSAEGIFNSTTNYILKAMAGGTPFAEALAKAQEVGIAEANPSLDIDGWDTANKLVIICNAVLGLPVRLGQVSVRGISGVGADEIKAATGRGEVIKLIASVGRRSGSDGDGVGEFSLSVEPRPVPAHSFLGSVDGWEMGVVFRSDLFETVSLKIDEPNVTPTSSAVLRDIVELALSDDNKNSTPPI